MTDDRAVYRKQLRETLAELRNAALAKLEGRGYDVRGKTPAQIRQLLKRRSLKKKTNANVAQQ